MTDEGFDTAFLVLVSVIGVAIAAGWVVVGAVVWRESRRLRG
jgi:hypothetical protein